MSAKPLPSLEGAAGDLYRASAAAGRLCVQRCADCCRWRHPPRLWCTACGSDRAEYAPVSGRGRIFTWTVTHQAFHPAFAADVPYAVVVTELEEGVRIVSGTRDLPLAELALDLSVEVELEERAPGVCLPVVRPAHSPRRS